MNKAYGYKVSAIFFLLLFCVLVFPNNCYRGWLKYVYWCENEAILELEECFLSVFLCNSLLLYVVKRYKQWDQNIPRYKNYISVLSKQITLEDIHNKIWKQIQYLQEEGNCEEKKIMHCENRQNYAGFGSMMMRYGACMQVAFASGRMLFIN